MPLFTFIVLLAIVQHCIAQYENCTINFLLNAKGDIVQEITASSAYDCCNKCASNPQCNTFTFCPRFDGCTNAYGIANLVVLQDHCDLKYQQKVAERQEPDYWSSGPGTEFQSGYIPGKSKPVGRCTIKNGGNAKGDLLSSGQTANTQDECCRKCENHWKCNVFVYCPNYDGCYNNGQMLPYQLCDLKYQYKVTLYQEPDYWYIGSAFISGYILGK
eukprot:TRINITY_DN4505_c0_g1_i1.p1 TRINITY_DN4505_c0_g1~~TRINITY_DN4505_c0_g1_i1.p1  ORF type:complete len:216 (-),score=2.97 TRINITY_DN4505_c0_g1_i1:578-1225(-)